MDEPKPLDSSFKEKLFRIPDYQRGYAWGREQLDAFWEDLVSTRSKDRVRVSDLHELTAIWVQIHSPLQTSRAGPFVDFGSGLSAQN